MSAYDQLIKLNIILPPARPPSGAYLPFSITNQLVFISGHTAKRDGKPWVGVLGSTMTKIQGQAAAYSIGIALMGTLQAAVGDLDRIDRIVRLDCLVNSAPDFIEQNEVADGASELLMEVFGTRGGHARYAVGVSQLPHGSCVEIEMLAVLK